MFLYRILLALLFALCKLRQKLVETPIKFGGSICIRTVDPKGIRQDYMAEVENL